MMSHKQKIESIVLLCLCVVGAGIFHQSPYYLALSDWVVEQRVLHTLHCQGQAQWLSKVAPLIINQDNPDPMTNVSLAYRSPQGELTTCVAGWIRQVDESPTITPQTVYQFASVTKVFTADTVLSLVRDGRLKLTDKLVDLLPELRGKKLLDDRVADITVAQLLLHEAGFDRSELGIGDDMFLRHPWCPSNVEHLTNTSLQFAPGSRYAYSNTGYCLLSRVIEEKYHQPFVSVIRQRYGLGQKQDLNFVTTADQLPNDDSAIKDIFADDVDYAALASSAGMYGTPSRLTELVHAMPAQGVFSLSGHLSDRNCDDTALNSCHVFMGNEFGWDNRLHFYWRDGSMPLVSALVIVDSRGGVLAMTTNVERQAMNNYRLIDDIYAYRLQHGYF